MSLTDTQIQQLKEAKALAKSRGCFVVEKGGRYLLYRERMPTNTLIGTRTDLGEFCALVRRACALASNPAVHTSARPADAGTPYPGPRGMRRA